MNFWGSFYVYMLFFNSLYAKQLSSNVPNCYAKFLPPYLRTASRHCCSKLCKTALILLRFRNELFYMPSSAENALIGLKAAVAADIERIVGEAVEKAIAAKCNEHK